MTDPIQPPGAAFIPGSVIPPRRGARASRAGPPSAALASCWPSS